MKFITPVIFLNRTAGVDDGPEVRDFRPANMLGFQPEPPVMAEKSIPIPVESTEDGPDPKVLSAQESVSGSGSETQSQTSLQEGSGNPASVVKVNLQHPSSMKTGNDEPPVVE